MKKSTEALLRGVGIFLAIIGIFLIIVQPPSPTGAVIDLSISAANVSFFAGIGAVIAGFILMISTYRTKSLDSIISEDKKFNGDVVYVIDSSGAIDYKQDIDKLIDQYEGRVFVPERILKELKKDSTLQRKFRDREGSLRVLQIEPKENLDNYKILRHLARDVLEKTRKHQDYLKLKRIIGEDVVPAGVSDKDFDRYMERMNPEIENRLKELDEEPTTENKLKLIKREYRVSKGDLDVLTTALINVGKGKRTRILGHDAHLRDAVAELLDAHKELKDYLEYIDYREYNAAA